MRVRPLTPLERRRADPPRRGAHAPARPAPAAPLEPERRVREAGGPRDSALYACSCGVTFRAKVSTSVTCPGCGADQAW